MALNIKHKFMVGYNFHFSQILKYVFYISARQDDAFTHVMIDKVDILPCTWV